MDLLPNSIDLHLRPRKRKTTVELSEAISKPFDLADADALDQMRSRERDQTVLDELDEFPAR